MKKVLIIGSTGLLGSEVTNLLIHQNKYQIGVLMRNKIKNKNKKVKMFIGDISDPKTLNQPINWADVVMNCSGKVSYKRKDKRLLNEVNYVGVKNILSVVKKYKKLFIHTSSAAVYGYSRTPKYATEEDIIDEGFIRNTKSAYYISKFESEKLIIKSGVQYTIFRLSSLVSNHSSTLSRIKKVIQNGIEPAFKGGASFVMVHDVAKAYVQALSKFNNSRKTITGIFNLGGHNMTFREISRLIKNRFNAHPVPVSPVVLYGIGIISDYFMEPLFGISILPIEQTHIANHYSYIDSTKAVKSLDYKISSLKETVEALIN